MPGVRQTTSGVVDTSTGVATTVTLPEILDDFEESSPLNDYRGETGAYTVQSTTVFNGSNALQQPADATGEVIFHDNSANEPTIETDATYRAALRGENAGGWRVGVGLFGTGTGQSDASGYLVEIRIGASDAIRIEEWSNGSTTKLGGAGSNSEALGGGTWGEIEFSVDTSTSPNTIEAELLSSNVVVTVQDDTYTSGDYWFRGNGSSGGGNEWYYDYLRKVSNSPR